VSVRTSHIGRPEPYLAASVCRFLVSDWRSECQAVEIVCSSTNPGEADAEGDLASARTDTIRRPYLSAASAYSLPKTYPQASRRPIARQRCHHFQRVPMLRSVEPSAPRRCSAVRRSMAICRHFSWGCD